MNNYQVISPQHLPLILLTSLWLLTPQKVSAGAIEISIDPYNDSGYETIPFATNQSVDNNRQTQTSPTPNLSVVEKENISSEGIYYVKGNSTPPPPQIVGGNLITSNQSLPAIPPLNEPYSPQQTADINSRNVTPANELSVSVSPFNVTPSKENATSNNVPTTNQTVAVNSNNNVRNINISPQDSNSISVSNNSNNSPIDNLGKRRNLREILVFSNSTNSENINNNGNNMPSESIKPSSNNSQTVYKVLAKTNSNSQEVGVKSLYPEAFKTNYQGQSLLQVGVFSTQENAEQVSQSLANIGVKAIILK
ncbi:hypothetical protein [Cyanobacterium sp. Dongsha4]|uniref:hypothetical protein n=1 Tax=Cyanobacterium sp. DS4 TaxID=2878255 RepID=UPI002E81E21F|nr:hypothetical protein [Cyanobacterium sp. Dongsha4]WVL00790.1 hypothetical protein Dongsha4_00915 [Cyanobacterium sp. Dongsha4]